MLFEIMNQFGSDKCNGWHNYTKIYETFFPSNSCTNVLEIHESNPQHLHACKDIQGSIKAWKKYFHGSSYIYGCHAENIYFNPDVELDLIIDDSGFSWPERLHTLQKSWNFLRVNGYYIIEDVLSQSVFQAHLDIYKLHEKYKFLQCHIYEIPNANNKFDNNLIVLQKSDHFILNTSNTLDNFS
jgi:hypothetical protein